MTEVDIILTALMAGAAAGTTAAAQSAVVDAYTALRESLRRALKGQNRPDKILDSVEAEPNTWRAELGEALTAAHIGQDAKVLAAAQAVLTAADPVGHAAGKYTVDASHAAAVKVGDHAVHVETNYGAAAGTMTGPVNVSYGQVPNPPAAPGA